MKCLHCDREMPTGFFDEKSRSEQFKGGRFACPHCGAEHVRRLVDQLPSGESVYSIRRWGHLTARRSPTPATADVAERRQAPRTKRWR